MQPSLDKITTVLLSMRNNIKIFHWRTNFYSSHKASDDFLSKFDANVDKIVEYMQGSRNRRINLSEFSKGIELYDINNSNIIAYLNNYKLWFTTTFTSALDSKKDVDILALRDEIVGDLNQFIYLLGLA